MLRTQYFTFYFLTSRMIRIYQYNTPQLRIRATGFEFNEFNELCHNSWELPSALSSLIYSKSLSLLLSFQ